MKYEYIIRLVEWIKINILLATKTRVVYFKECEIWWCSVGLNIGEEEFGKGPVFERPILIFKKFTKDSFLGLPLTSQIKEGSWYVPVVVNGKRGSIMLNQARIFDKARLSNRITTINETDFEEIRLKFRELYCPINVRSPHLEGETGTSGKSQIVP